MKCHEELIARLAHRRNAKLGDLSKSGFEELLRAVRAHPNNFIDDPRDEAFSLVVDALDRYERAREADDLIEADEAFFVARQRRVKRLYTDCGRALARDENCADALLCRLLAQDLRTDDRVDQLVALQHNLEDYAQAEPLWTAAQEGRDAWDNVFTHGLLRIEAALSRALFDTARYGLADKACRQLLAKAPSDALGARHTCFLVLARLEDEEAFDALDVQLGRHGDSWSHLARVILLYKLNRLPAAKRALFSYAHLIEGGVFALLRPVLIDTYIPDRPETPENSFKEATLAVHEADPIVVDTPDLLSWAESMPKIASDAQEWAERNGFMW